jgi:hypothetical protein
VRWLVGRVVGGLWLGCVQWVVGFPLISSLRFFCKFRFTCLWKICSGFGHVRNLAPPSATRNPPPSRHTPMSTHATSNQPMTPISPAHRLCCCCARVASLLHKQGRGRGWKSRQRGQSCGACLTTDCQRSKPTLISMHPHPVQANKHTRPSIVHKQGHSGHRCAPPESNTDTVAN